jgi:translocation and assembly module TamA
VAAFVDVGDAFDNKAPDLRTGAGLGLRWQSPVGPVKVDLGHGFDEPGDDFRIHFSLGPEL